MEINFQPTVKDYQEFGRSTLLYQIKFLRKHPYLRVSMLLIFFLLPIVACNLFIWEAQTDEMVLINIFTTIVEAIFVLFMVILLTGIMLRFTYKKMAKRHGLFPSTIWLTEEGITTELNNGALKMFCSWSMVDTLYVTKNLYIFVLGNGIGVFFNKEYLQGREPLLMQMVAYSMPGKPVIRC